MGRIRKNKLWLFWLVFSLFPFLTSAQDSIQLIDSTRVKSKLLNKVIAYEGAYYLGSMAVLRNTWYKDRQRVPFHFYNDNKGYLQVDKFGHAFGAYAISYIGYHSLLNTGMSKKNALMYGGTLGLVLQTPIEIMDGIHEGWGFSWGDMAANAIGSGLFIGQQLLFEEQILTYKISYWESVYAKNSNNLYGKTSLERALKDYNGHTYWLSMPVNKLIQTNHFPNWLNISVGYGANGLYGEYHNSLSYEGAVLPEAIRYRQFLLSLDVNWNKIPTNSKVLKMIFQGLTFIKIPFPTLEYNSKGKLKGYWIYF